MFSRSTHVAASVNAAVAAVAAIADPFAYRKLDGPRNNVAKEIATTEVACTELSH